VQNQKRTDETRRCFTARPGHLFAQADATGLELATWAQACIDVVGYSTLAEEINAGIDPHLSMGADILGITYEEAVARKRDPEVKEARQLAKPANFGFPGGMGAEAFVSFARGYGIKLSVGRGKELRDIWRAKRPEHERYFEWAGTVSRGDGTVVQLRSGRLRGDCRFTQAANTLFQGLGADAVLRGHWYVTQAAYAEEDSILWRALWPVLFIHDEVIAETLSYDSLRAASREEREDVAARALEMARLLEKGTNEFLPNVPVTFPPTLAKWWAKQYMDEPVYDEDGILVPRDLAEIEGVPVFYADGKEVTC
jgi:DNA polymerase-1